MERNLCGETSKPTQYLELKLCGDTPKQCKQPYCKPNLLYGKPYTTVSCDDYRPPEPEAPDVKLITYGDYCGRTKRERIEDANRRMNNRIFFMGITAHGYQQPIREAINPSCIYRDKNIGRPEIEQFLPKKDANTDYAHLAENFRNIDIYSGLVDGRSYGRYHRLHYQKIRHTRNPYGTEVRFCTPIANNMNYGWWTRDMIELNKNKWFAPRERFPQVRGEITKFVDDMAVHDPNFIMF